MTDILTAPRDTSRLVIVLTLHAVQNVAIASLPRMLLLQRSNHPLVVGRPRGDASLERARVANDTRREKDLFSVPLFFGDLKNSKRLSDVEK